MVTTPGPIQRLHHHNAEDDLSGYNLSRSVSLLCRTFLRLIPANKIGRHCMLELLPR